MSVRWVVGCVFLVALAGVGGGDRFLEASAAHLRVSAANPTEKAGMPLAGDGLSPIPFDTESGIVAVNTADSEAEALRLKEAEEDEEEKRKMKMEMEGGRQKQRSSCGRRTPTPTYQPMKLKPVKRNLQVTKPAQL